MSRPETFRVEDDLRNNAMRARQSADGPVVAQFAKPVNRKDHVHVFLKPGAVEVHRGVRHRKIRAAGLGGQHAIGRVIRFERPRAGGMNTGGVIKAKTRVDKSSPHATQGVGPSGSPFFANKWSASMSGKSLSRTMSCSCDV